MASPEIINPLICNLETGVCEIGEDASVKSTAIASKAVSAKPITLTYFTDPICSSCWGIEPQLRRLKLEYGHYFNLEYRMGGLLPSWSIYRSSNISQPSDVAGHWDEVSQHYGMPIDGDLWLEDPLDSSYPPSVAFKAVQLQARELASKYLRRLREWVFVQKVNIARPEVLEQAAGELGLDLEQFRQDLKGAAKELFEADLAQAQQDGVRSFPTFISTAQSTVRLGGVRGYGAFEQLVLNHIPQAYKELYDPEPQALLEMFESLTAKELAVLQNTTFEAASASLQALAAQGKVSEVRSKNGSVWRRN